MSKSTAPLRQRLKEVASEAMLDAAERCMIRDGYEATTMQQIATEAGCATGTFYLYFKNKEEILRAVVARHSSVVFRQVRQAFDQAPDPLAKVKAGITQFLRYAHDNRGFFQLFLTALPMRHRALRQHVDEGTWKEHLAQTELELDALREAQRLGQIRSDLPVEYIQDSMMALCVNNMEHFMSFPHPPSADEQAEMVWTLIYSGIGVKA